MEDRVVAITGGFGVLGTALGALAVERGLRVALIDAAPAAQTSLAATDRVAVLPGTDLTVALSAQSAMDAVAQQFGRLDALLNVAGGFRWEAFEGGALETWPSLYRVNVLTATNASRAALPFLRRSPAGRIVNVGSAAALNAGAGMGAYAAAKAGVHSLTQALAAELKASGLTVNAVLPSIIDTPTNRREMPLADPGAWIAARDLAEVMLFLASPAATAVTGALIPVTGRG